MPAQKSVGTSTVLWRGLHSIRASWLPTSLRMRLISLPVIAPCHDVAMAAHRDKPLAVRFVLGTRLSIPCSLGWHGSSGESDCMFRAVCSKFFRFSAWVVYKYVLVIDVVARQQHAHRGGKTQPAIAPVGGGAFQTGSPCRACRASPPRPESVCRHRMSSPMRISSGYSPMSFSEVVSVCESEKYFSMIPARPSSPVISGAVSRASVMKPLSFHDALELPDRFDELCCRFLVRYLLRDNPAPAERGEVALSGGFFLWSSWSGTGSSSGSGNGRSLKCRS